MRPNVTKVVIIEPVVEPAAPAVSGAAITLINESIGNPHFA
jgi:hypothetical protein